MSLIAIATAAALPVLAAAVGFTLTFGAAAVVALAIQLAGGIGSAPPAVPGKPLTGHAAVPILGLVGDVDAVEHGVLTRA